MYLAIFRQFDKQLAQLDKWLEATTAYAETKKFDPNIVLAFRLAPDQFPFSRQIQIACDTAKLGASRLTGVDGPSHADTESTLAELRTRIGSVRAYLGDLTEASFANATTRVITQPRWEGKTMTGHDYFIEHVVPNFYFHLNHTYAILRHNGVPLGKRDYLGALTQNLPA
jgi:hypothetical protein